MKRASSDKLSDIFDDKDDLDLFLNDVEEEEEEEEEEEDEISPTTQVRRKNFDNSIYITGEIGIWKTFLPLFK